MLRVKWIWNPRRFSKKSEIFTKIQIFAKIRDFHENPGFSRRSEIFAKIQDFRENPRFSRKSEIFAKIRDFHGNPRFSRKSRIFAKILNFRENPTFLSFCSQRRRHIPRKIFRFDLFLVAMCRDKIKDSRTDMWNNHEHLYLRRSVLSDGLLFCYKFHRSRFRTDLEWQEN